jgi:hypothetical protein
LRGHEIQFRRSHEIRRLFYVTGFHGKFLIVSLLHKIFTRFAQLSCVKVSTFERGVGKLGARVLLLLLSDRALTLAEAAVCNLRIRYQLAQAVELTAQDGSIEIQLPLEVSGGVL